MKIHTKIAKKLSYGGKRPYKDIKYIVIHFTANKGDTAKNNAVFYAEGNTREAFSWIALVKFGSRST